MSERYQLLHSHTEVDQSIARMASEITAKHDDEPPLFVTLLRGGNTFGSRLYHEISRQAPDFHPEVDYMMTSRDNAIINSPTILKMDLDPDTEVKNRTVIVVDSMLSMGETALFVRNRLLQLGARYIELAVLVEKEIARTTGVDADYVGFHTPDQWLVGMGMDDSPVAKESYRWRNGIWSVTPDDLPPKSALVNA